MQPAGFTSSKHRIWVYLCKLKHRWYPKCRS